jgi:hypothetical protein
MSGKNIIGEVTESIQKFINDGWLKYSNDTPPPRIEEDLKYEPMDRNEQVVYVYMYRLAANPNLMNQKRWRQAPVFTKDDPSKGNVYYHRPPVLVDLFYLLMVHSRFRSEAERLLGWLMLQLNEATHLIYRPRKFILPDGREVDSLGNAYDLDILLDSDGLVIEKVSLALVDDLTVGDATNLFSLHEAPYRPFLTYRARIALDGPLVRVPGGTSINFPRAQSMGSPNEESRKNGRVLRGKPGKMERSNYGPPSHNLKRDSDPDNND